MRQAKVGQQLRVWSILNGISRLSGIFFFILLVVLAGAPLCRAQLTTTASITGTVRDPSGATVPGATVTATNQETTVQATTKTNADGSFVLPSLIVGTYKVAINKQGFETFTEIGIILHPAQVATVNATIRVGEVTTQVRVVASAVQVQTATPGITNEVSGAQTATLPLDGRNYQSLAALMPGVTNLRPDTALYNGGALSGDVMSVNGMGNAGTQYYLDGIWDMNTGSMNSQTVTPDPDQIEEARVLQNNYGVQYSLNGTNVVLLQTKSGTATFHGLAFEYLRNNDFDARNFFAPTVPALKQNIFGGTLGGPLFIPGHRPKNPKTFFFMSTQVVTQSIASAILGATATRADRSGQFSTPITNPQTGQPFPDNTIPANMINPQSLLLMNSLAQLPNNGTSFFNFLNLGPAFNKTRDDEFKIDRNFASRFHLMAEYLHEQQEANNSYDTFLGSPFTTNTDPIYTNDQLAQIQLTTSISPDMVNTTSISMNNLIVSLGVAGIEYTSQVPGFSEALPYEHAFLANRLPQITFAQGYAPFGADQTLPIDHASDLEDTVSDDWSWLHGNHYIQAGATALLGTKRQTNGQPTNGTWFFSGQFTGNALADYLLGDASTFRESSASPRFYIHYPIDSPYVQDRWKATRRLTLTGGLRFLFEPTSHGQHAFESDFDPTVYNPSEAPIVNANGTITPTPNYNPLNGVIINGINGVPLNFTDAHQYYWAPSVGFAWDVFGNGKTALRGGYSLTYENTFHSDCSGGCSSNFPFVESLTLEEPHFPNPIGAAAAPTPAPTFGSGEELLNEQAPMIQTYSLSLEHQFRGGWLASIAGAGDIGRHLGMFYNINQPLPDAPYNFNPIINTGTVFPYLYSPYLGSGAIENLGSSGNSYWNALEIGVRHPVGHNLFLNVSYTWQHGLSDTRGQTLFGEIGGPQDEYHPGNDYGNSNVDVPQILSFSYIWSLPWYQNASGWKRWTLGGWKYGGMTTIQSGFALNPGLSIPFPGLATRPDISGKSIGGPKTAQEWFNTAAFTAPPFGYFGDAAPGSIYGPGAMDFDMALYKDFHFTERTMLEFRAEAFNVFNHTNFSGVQTALGAGNYGEVTSALDPRIMEFALRFSF